MDEQRVKTREFRQLLREFVEAVRLRGSAVIIQSNGKDVAVLVSYERYQELRKKAGEIKDDKPKQVSTRKRLPLSNVQPLTCLDVSA